MNFTLKRYKSGLYGIFGQLYSEDGKYNFVSLEHGYSVNGEYLAKVAIGEYKCVRHAPHRLPYETFTLENVPPFQDKEVTGILIHKGNYNNDSIGCILIGTREGTGMIEDSKDAFEAFMTLQDGLDSFTLTIS